MKIEKLICIVFICLMSCVSQTKINDSCSSYPKKGYVPIDLYDAVEYLNCQWSAKDKRKIGRLLEDEAVGQLHFGTGMGIRNGWELWQGENELVKFFNSHGIFHPDDMSSIILTSFHRKLNNKGIDFESQVQYYLDYWKPIQEYEEKETKRVLAAYDKYNLGDTITIYMEMDEGNAVVGIGSGYEWTFNPENDLEFKGKIIEKTIIEDSTNVRLLTHVLHINKEGTIEILGKQVKLGDTIVVDLRYLRYE